jgi:glutamine synthetase
MKEMEEELWKLGVLAKTKHNEVAPAQHELAPFFSTTNIATDHNQLTMELMKRVANKHGLACLLHEKPFAGINGSGKHNNWSISTDAGVNLLEPGETPFDNAQFLLFLVAVIKAVDDYQDLLRASVASAGNDHRLGANEAPPAIVSIFVGEELNDILTAIDAGASYRGKQKVEMEIGATVLPHFPKDTTDRNRTSPFAFTGNKFEFRMLGSTFSLSECNVVLNTAVAESLRQFADRLEGSENFVADLGALIKETIGAHKRIIFNGNGYDESWVTEAAKRGLLNLKTTPEALPVLIDQKNIDLFERHKVFTAHEIHSRYEIFLENYAKTLGIEALTMIDLVNKAVVPAVIGYQNELAALVARKRKLGDDLPASLEENLLRKLSELSAALEKRLEELKKQSVAVRGIEDSLALSKAYREQVFTAMSELRLTVDELETLVSRAYWTIPTYTELLYSVN